MRNAEKSLDNTYAKIYQIDDETVQSLKEWDYFRLVISDGYSEFEDLTALKAPEIVSKVKDLYLDGEVLDPESLYSFSNLESIYIREGSKFPRGFKFDFNQFNGLKEATVYFSPSTKHILQAQNLESLNIFRFKGSLDDLSALTRLHTLKITQSNFESLKGIERLSQLKVLNIFKTKKLTDITALLECKFLEEINIQEVGLIDVNLISKIHSLKKIFISKEFALDSFSFFTNLENLESIHTQCQFNSYDIEKLFSLNNLKKVRLMDLKNFDSDADELEKLMVSFGKSADIDVIQRGKASKTIDLTFF